MAVREKISKPPTGWSPAKCRDLVNSEMERRLTISRTGSRSRGSE